MLTHDSSYDASLRGSVTKPWTVDDCFRGRDFDFTKPFLPELIAGVDAIGCLTDDERDEIRTHQRRAYRWTFLVSGLQHPNFVRIVEQLTDTGTDKIASAAHALSA